MSIKLGIYVDVFSITQEEGRGMRYEVLRQFASNLYENPVNPTRLKAYTFFDSYRDKEDSLYAARSADFMERLRDFGYQVKEILKPDSIRSEDWNHPESHWADTKAAQAITNALTNDLCEQGPHMDHILLVTANPHFTETIEILQNKGVRVDVLAFSGVPNGLRIQADNFYSGWLIPELLGPVEGGRDLQGKVIPWGEENSRVRGLCYVFFPEKHFGFCRFLNKDHNGPLWITDARDPRSPYQTAFCHGTMLPHSVPESKLPTRELILEFTLTRSSRNTTTKDFQASEIILVEDRNFYGNSYYPQDPDSFGDYDESWNE